MIIILNKDTDSVAGDLVAVIDSVGANIMMMMIKVLHVLC
jgi:hypothetical protein